MTHEHNIGAAHFVINRRYTAGDLSSEVANALDEMMEAYHNSGGLLPKEVSDAMVNDVCRHEYYESSVDGEKYRCAHCGLIIHEEKEGT